MAKLGAKVWREYGALEYYECIGDDLKVKMVGSHFQANWLFSSLARRLSFPGSSSNRAEGHRDRVNAKVMKTPRMNDPQMQKAMPFEMNRMSYGGFKTLVHWTR